MSITKRAFLQGLQRSLVSSGAIPPYSSKWQQKHALDQAEEKSEEREEEKKKKQKKNDLPVTEEKKPEELSEEEVSEMMTDIVEAEPLDEAIEALQEYQEAAGDSEAASDELVDALEDLKDSKEAALAIRRLKMASSSPTGGGRKGNELGPIPGKKVLDMETGEGHPERMPADLRVDQLEYDDFVGPNNGDSAATLSSKLKDRTSAKKAPTKGEVKAAMAILRKLAGEVGEAKANKMIGAGQVDAEYGEDDPGPNPHIDPSEIMKARDEVVLPHPAKEAALAHLVAKTAQEVGHFLPQGLNSSDKLAALRTMVGMNGQERAAYIGRIKEAMYNPYQEQNQHDYQASQVLRNLGL